METGQSEAPAVRVAGLQTERRVAWLTPLIGAAAGAVVYALRYDSWAAGIALGAGLGWLNFRWLRRGMNALVGESLEQEGAKKPQVPLGTYFTAAFRYALLALGVYVIFRYLHVPLGSLMVGLCALGAAAVAASVWEILDPAD